MSRSTMKLATLAAVLVLVFLGTTVNAQAKQTGKITFYTIDEWTKDPNLAPNFDALVKRFKKDNPGCEVEVISDPFMTWMQKYQVMFAAGNAPDVDLIGNSHFPIFANAGNLVDLGSVFGEDYFKDFSAGVTKMYVWQGKHYAVPFTMDTRVLYYNKDLFKKAGLDPQKPPRTWAELKDYARKLTMDTNGSGKANVYGFGMDLALKEFVQQAIFCASPGNIITIDSQGNIRPNVDTPEFKAYLQLLKDMVPYYEPDFATTDNGQVGTLFAKQKVAMITNGPWIFDQNKEMQGASWIGQGMIPKMDAKSPEGSFGGGFVEVGF